MLPVANGALAQRTMAEFRATMKEKSAFDEAVFATLAQGQSVVRLLPVNDKREVAVCGLVGLQVPAQEFLQSFRESMTSKTNPAILEIGRFSATPTLDDLQTLTFEDSDLDDLRECVVGDCKLKLSATMIERLQKEVNWDAPDYRSQANQLLKEMLVSYVRDYLAHGDEALIKYNDKPVEIRMAEEQRALMNAPGYLNSLLLEFPRQLKGSANSETSIVEDAIVWSKIRFGLKPVIAINHIKVYKREQGSGPQVLVAAKQIYANHYFDSSLALTAFVVVPGADPASYLIYENRSRADGLGGMFSKMKRSLVEDRALDSLQTILDSSKANLTARTLNQSETTTPLAEGRGWKRWRLGGVHLVAWLGLITAFVALFLLSNYGWKKGITGGAHG